MFDYYPYFIAEVGVNHDGDTGKAKELIDAAKEVGCHAV
jgi:sialic acid synthase SpsE